MFTVEKIINDLDNSVFKAFSISEQKLYKFQSCGEIESNRRFEFSVLLKADILSVFFY